MPKMSNFKIEKANVKTKNISFPRKFAFPVKKINSQKSGWWGCLGEAIVDALTVNTALLNRLNGSP